MGYQYRFDVAGTEYGMSDVQSAKLEQPLFDRFSVGNACSAELEITLWPKSVIPRMAQIIPYVIYEDGSEYKLGEFWTDTREQSGTALHIVAYDAMMRGEAVWVPRDDLDFPEDGLPMTDAVAEIASLMGVEIDDRTVLNSGYTIDYPTDEQTLRQTLMWIAAAHAGNWIITNEGKLLLVPLFSAPVETNYLVTENGEVITLGGVKILV